MLGDVMRKISVLFRCACLALIATAAALPSSAMAQSAPAVFGRTIGDWAASAFQFFAAQPYSTLPACGTKARTGPVWFLAGDWRGWSPSGPYSAEFECTVPREVHVFFSVATSFWIQTPLDDPSYTEMDWRAFAHSGLPYFWPELYIEVELDGRLVTFDPKTPIVEAQTPVFKAIWNDDNMFDIDPAAYLNGNPIVNNGYFVMLPPMSPGEHVLKIRPMLGIEWTYRLTVR
jgi:hypothetical protein